MPTTALSEIQPSENLYISWALSSHFFMLLMPTTAGLPEIQASEYLDIYFWPDSSVLVSFVCILFYVLMPTAAGLP
jgi:hypothetical protein